MSKLQENLRRHLLARIEAGEFTGASLADRTGFKQAHISNFLNCKRRLSFEGMDRILGVLKLDVFDLIPATEFNSTASLAACEEDSQYVPLVNPDLCDRAILSNELVSEVHKLKRTFLQSLRPDPASDRDHWDRFVLIRAGIHDGQAMYPRLQTNAIVLIDRHYNSLNPYRKQDRTIYAVRRESGNGTLIRYVEQHGRRLTLRPQNDHSPLEFVSINSARTFADYIIGRVAHIAIET